MNSAKSLNLIMFRFEIPCTTSYGANISQLNRFAVSCVEEISKKKKKKTLLHFSKKVIIVFEKIFFLNYIGCTWLNLIDKQKVFRCDLIVLLLLQICFVFVMRNTL